MSFKILSQQNSNISQYAYVFCVFKNSEYMLGAMAAAHSIKLTNSISDLVLMVTEDINQEIISLASKVFNVIVEVPYLTTYTIPLRTQKQQKMYNSWKEIAFTKWNCLNLYQYEKVMFVDSDKIIIENIEHLFQLQTPAGTFSSPQAQSLSNKKGMTNPYIDLNHGDIVTNEMIQTGLGLNLEKNSKIASFIVIGTMVILSPSLEIYNEFVKMLTLYTIQKPFGFNCNNMMDEQALVYFYLNKKQPWTFLGIRYNFIPWHLEWLNKNELPALFHYFGVKPWILNRTEWIDLEIWWTIVKNLLTKKEFTAIELKELEKLYRKDQLELTTQIGCFYCKLFKNIKNENWKSHQFMNDKCQLVCKRYLKS